MRYEWLAVSGVALALMMGSGCVVNPERTSGRVVVQDENTRIEVVFNEHDRRRIRDYYDARAQEKSKNKKKEKQMPPGLAKREQLPPGLQNQVQKKGKLPPGLEGRNLPTELERQLSPLPQGYVRLEVGTDIVLMDGATHVIVDVIKDLPL